jgi:hypothetical protein
MVDGRWWTMTNDPTVRQRVVSPPLYEHDRRRHTFPPREMVLSGLQGAAGNRCVWESTCAAAATGEEGGW